MDQPILDVGYVDSDLIGLHPPCRPYLNIIDFFRALAAWPNTLFRNSLVCQCLFLALGFILTIKTTRESFFFGVRIWLSSLLDRFSIINFRGLGLRIRAWVRVSVVLWSG